PWNPDHVPGGSSGGAAAATAALMGPLHIGTDGGGSARIPAAFCGVVGLKPTLGLISNRGHTGGGDSSFSVPGPLARTVRDAAIVAQAIAGFDPAYAYSRPGPVPDLLQDLEAGVDGLRIGTSRDALRPQPDAAVDAAYAATRDRLAALGVRVVDVRLPHHDLVLPVVLAVFAVEGEVALEARRGEPDGAAGGRDPGGHQRRPAGRRADRRSRRPGRTRAAHRAGAGKNGGGAPGASAAGRGVRLRAGRVDLTRPAWR